MPARRSSREAALEFNAHKLDAQFAANLERAALPANRTVAP